MAEAFVEMRTLVKDLMAGMRNSEAASRRVAGGAKARKLVLYGRVEWNGFAFRVSHLGESPWTDAILTVSAKAGDRFNVALGNLFSGDQIECGALHAVNDAGERLNPFDDLPGTVELSAFRRDWPDRVGLIGAIPIAPPTADPELAEWQQVVEYLPHAVNEPLHERYPTVTYLVVVIGIGLFAWIVGNLAFNSTP